MSMAEALFPGPVPKEALEYFRAKGFKVGFSFEDVWQAEHARAFTVAKAMNLDLLQTIRLAVDDAIANGKPLRDFAKDLTPLLQDKGWWGRQPMKDPVTGEVDQVQLGSPRRLRTIYDTNLRTAHAAGQWERIQRNKKTHPYLLYSLGPSQEHRAEHVAWAGICLPADHPWWHTHFPQNGWGCKCRVTPVSKRQYERLKSEGMRQRDGTYIPVQLEAPEIELAEYVSQRTGEVISVPIGIDPGWDYNPGLVRQADLLKQTATKLQAADPAIAKESIKQLVQGEAFAYWYEKPEGLFPVAWLSATDAALINAGTNLVEMSPDTLAKQRRSHPELAPDEYPLALEAIERGRVIQDSATSLVYLLEEPQGYTVVVKATKTGKAVFVTSVRRLSSDQAKRDAEIQRLLRRGKE